MTILRAVVCLLGALLLSAQADAGTLYGATAAGSAGELYILDATSGAMIQDVGPLNNATGTNYPVTGLAFHPLTGVLYGSTGNTPAETGARLIVIDPSTALVSVIGSFNAGPINSSGTPSTMADLAFDAGGDLFGIGSIGGPQLYSIDILTGQATVIGSTGLTSTTGGGLAVGPDGTFYGTPTSSRFGTYDPSTGAYTNIANPSKPAGGAYGALDFDGSVLYGLNVGAGSPPPTHLVIIDPTTGAVTDLGISVTALDAIAFRPATAVPEPDTMTFLVASIAVGLATCHALRRTLGRCAAQFMG
jgi:uncharacterized protein DUF6923